jgi:hypothetical protein
MQSIKNKYSLYIIIVKTLLSLHYVFSSINFILLYLGKS